MKILAVRVLKTAMIDALAVVVTGCWMYTTQDTAQHPEINQFGLHANPHSTTVWLGGIAAPSAYSDTPGRFKRFLKKYSNGQWLNVEEKSAFPDESCGPYGSMVDARMTIAPNDSVAWFAICEGPSNTNTSDTDGPLYTVTLVQDDQLSIMHSAHLSDSPRLILRDARITDNGDAFVLIESRWVTYDSARGYQIRPNYFFYERKDEVISAEEYLLSFQDQIPRDDVANVRAALSEEGSVLAAWSDKQGRIYFTEYRNGTLVRPVDENDNINPPGSGISPRVAISANGDALIAWSQASELDNVFHEFDSIYVSSYHNGQWLHPSAEQHLNTNKTPVTLGPVAIDSNGDAMVLWRQSTKDFSNFDLFVSEFRNGAWLPADNRIQSNPQGVPYPAVDLYYPQADPYNFRLAMADNGDAAILWTSQGRIYKSEYRDGQWYRPGNADDGISVPGYAVDTRYGLPAILMDAQGNTLVVWSHVFSDHIRHLYASDYRNGEWHHPQTRNNFVDLNFWDFDQGSYTNAKPFYSDSQEGDAFPN